MAEPTDDDTLGPVVSKRLAEFKITGTTKRRTKGIRLACVCGATIQAIPVGEERDLTHAAYADALLVRAGTGWHRTTCKAPRP